MDSSSRFNGLGMELLNQSNYKVWRSCMESYLVGEDLWDIVGGDNAKSTEPNEGNAEVMKKWKILNGKAEFALKRSISHGLFEHIIKCKSANEIKNLCSEISLLDPDEPISEARLRRHIVRGLKSEYTPFITSIQGWAQQPSLEELENLLNSHESLAKQIAGIHISEGEGDALLADGKNFKRREWKFDQNRDVADSSEKGGRKLITCHRCGKPGHIKKKCRVRVQETNVAATEEDDSQMDEDWGKCFVAKAKSIDALASINFEDEWIVDSGCEHHLTGDDSKFSSLHDYNGKYAIVTADNSVHSVSKEGRSSLMGLQASETTILPMSTESSNGSQLQDLVPCEKGSTSCQMEDNLIQDLSSGQSPSPINPRPRRNIVKPARYQDENFVNWEEGKLLPLWNPAPNPNRLISHSGTVQSVEGLVRWANILWNPSTRKSIILPHQFGRIEVMESPGCFKSYVKYQYVLGFDTCSEVHKVLSFGYVGQYLNKEDGFITHSRILAPPITQICTLGTNSRRDIHLPDQLKNLRLDSCGKPCCISGVVYLGGYRESLMSCDLSKEVFRMVPLPQDAYTRDEDYGDYGREMFEFRERLPLLVTKHSKIWILKDLSCVKWNSINFNCPAESFLLYCFDSKGNWRRVEPICLGSNW
ncbi:hypothetical protein ACH5RR_036041 [Cinchona calisaya]|uniref:CCHC-type domain-containing protein n=1 Tax=Cinchona calisaya TaxID=153742 RepID=A0ABD2Y599_9GENT